ncbi:MAG: ABC transporter permease [Bacteroidales bacterium]|nr:ABC transporter permease [Lentimicrobiaceae bacterium]MBQ2853071.1 ABC transporter permease [Bacteroidales bacterium]MBR7176350.1 ABC transporter permease [Bacteroidales bacterium]
MKNFINNKKTYIVISSIVLMLILWEIISIRVGSKHIMPGPLESLKAAINLFSNNDFLITIGSTILRGIIGFLIAIIAGITLGIIAGLNPSFETFMKPWIVLMRSVPIVSFILLALIWFTSKSVPIFIGILTMFPMIFTNITEGMHNVDSRLIDMAKLYKVSRKRIVSQVYIPAIIPFVTSGISSAVGIGWRAIIVGEVLSLPEFGIGTSMHSAQSFLNVDILIAWTFIAVMLSYLFETLIRFIEHKIIRWR